MQDQAIVGPAEPDRDRDERGQDRPAEVATNIILRRSQRSAYAPAGRPTSRSGSVVRTPTMPMAKPEPVRREHEQRHRRVRDRVAEQLETPWPNRTIEEVAVLAERLGGAASVVGPGARRGQRAAGRRRRSRAGVASRGGARAAGYVAPHIPAVARADTPGEYASTVLQLAQTTGRTETTIAPMTDDSNGNASGGQPIRRHADQLRRRR